MTFEISELHIVRSDAVTDDGPLRFGSADPAGLVGLVHAPGKGYVEIWGGFLSIFFLEVILLQVEFNQAYGGNAWKTPPKTNIYVS